MPTTEHIKTLLNNIPQKVGIYRYYDKNEKLLYIGKAKNIKKRVSSYFTKKQESGKIKVLVSKIFDIQICIIGRDKNILLEQQTRIRSKHTTPIALKYFKHLLKYNPYFISYELFHLYGLDYCKSISTLLNFPINTRKVKELLKPKYNTNKKYITKIKKGLFDKQAYRTSYVES